MDSFPNFKAFQFVKYCNSFEASFELKNLNDLVYLVQTTKLELTELEKKPILLARWFALAKEISLRTLGLKHFDSQILAGFYLINQNIVEMGTGEGKTLAISLPASVLGIGRKSCHVVTQNEYLANRDKKFLEKFFDTLGISCGLVLQEMSLPEKQLGYDCDITYASPATLIFDYLRTDISRSALKLKQNACIIDEVDKLLIDNAHRSYILSEDPKNKGGGDPNVQFAKKIIKKLKLGQDFKINFATKEIEIEHAGAQKLLSFAGIPDCFDIKNKGLLLLKNAIKAQYVYRKNRDYIICNNRIVIVDPNSGRTLANHTWDSNLQNAIEAKESILQNKVGRVKQYINNESFFKLYPTILGLSGTALSEKTTFKDRYKLETKKVPSLSKNRRVEKPHVICGNTRQKFESVIKCAKVLSARGQPVLICTNDIKTSEKVSRALNELKLEHALLNAKPYNSEKESEVIQQAGLPYSLTVSTNMICRGTDIKLGDDKNKKMSPYFNKQFCSNFIKRRGGLALFNIEMPANPRLLIQLKGRVARQGDPGVFVNYFSPEDPITELFPKALKQLLTILTARWKTLLPTFFYYAQAYANKKARKAFEGTDSIDSDFEFQRKNFFEIFKQLKKLSIKKFACARINILRYLCKRITINDKKLVINIVNSRIPLFKNFGGTLLMRWGQHLARFFDNATHAFVTKENVLTSRKKSLRSYQYLLKLVILEKLYS